MIKSLLFTSLIRFSGFSLLAVSMLLLAACGGGGGGGGTGSNGGTGNGSDTTPVDTSGGGSISTPATLVLDTLYNGSLKAGGTIYYKFTTGTRTLKYLVDLQNVSDYLGWTLYSDANYSVYKDSCSQTTDTGDCDTFNKLTAETTYYLKVQNLSTLSDDFTVRLDRILEPEGSFSLPVELTIGSEYVGMLGPKLYTSEVVSYYSFTTGAADSTHTISLTGATTDVRWKLYNSGWNDGVSDCDANWGVGDENCVTPTLTANTAYYLKVITQGPQGSFVNILVNAGGTQTNSYSSEGSIEAPVALTMGQSQALTVAALETSYYSFTTGDVAASYSFELDRVSTVFDFFIYDDAAFTNKIGGTYNGGGTSFYDVKETTITLDPNTTYYVSLKNFRDTGDQIELNLYEDTPQDPDSEGTSLTPVVLTVDTLHNGTIGSQAASFYKFTFPESKPYTIQFRNAAVELSPSIGTEFYSLYGMGPINCTMLTGFDMDCELAIQTANSELLMHLYNYDTTTATTFDVTVVKVEGEGEGNSFTPVAIDVGTSYNSSLGGNTGAYGDNISVYEFTTGVEPLKHRISVAGASTAVEWIADDPDASFTTLECLNPGLTAGDWVCDSALLKPNTRFILTVKNLEATNTPISILVEAMPTQTIPLDTTLIGESVNLNSGLYNYYQFTTDAVSTDYTFRITNTTVTTTLYMSIFADNAFSTNLNGCDSVFNNNIQISCTIRGLTPSTTYYLRVSPGNYTAVGTYDLAVLNDGFKEINATLTLGVDHNAKVASDDISTYQFTTAGGAKAIHSITVTGNVRINVSVYSDAAMTSWVQGCNLNFGDGTATCVGSTTLSGSTTYFVKVSDTGGWSGEYTLNIAPQ